MAIIKTEKNYMRELFVPPNKCKIIIMFIIFCSSFSNAQEVSLKSFILNENLREELILVNNYIKELKDEKLIPGDSLFIRFEAGEAFVGEVLNLRFMGNYYRNVSYNEELYYKTCDNVFYIFDYETIPYLKDSINFSLIKHNNLKDYGKQRTDEEGFGLEMGELSFEKSCGKYFLTMVTGMPYIEKYYKKKF